MISCIASAETQTDASLNRVAGTDHIDLTRPLPRIERQRQLMPLKRPCQRDLGTAQSGVDPTPLILDHEFKPNMTRGTGHRKLRSRLGRNRARCWTGRRRLAWRKWTR